MTSQFTIELPAAVLWDFDGTLLDTEPLWLDAAVQLLAEYDTYWSHELGAHLAGCSWIESTSTLIKAIGDESIDPYEFHRRRVQVVAQRLRELDELPWRPGAQKLLNELSEVKVPMGLVSASARPLLDAGLERIGSDRFEVIVDGDSVTCGKPDPEGYLKAMASLEVNPKDCVVIEDSVAGTAAGRASGAFVVAVPDLRSLEEQENQEIVDSLEQIDVVWLKNFMVRQRGEL